MMGETALIGDNFAMPISVTATAGGNPQLALSRLVFLRWLLLGGALAAVLATPPLLDIPLPLPPMLLVLLLLGAFNLLSARRLARAETGGVGLCLQQIADVVGLGVLLFLSGGAANPLVSLLLLPVATGALTLSARGAAAVATLAIAAYSLLTVWYVPLPIGDADRAARLHLAGMWLTFVASVLLIAWLIVRMNASVRARDAALASAREQALRDERVVALGTLAAGAAHELGTPLTTMAVIVGECIRDESLPAIVRDDMATLRGQIAACKEIVSGLAQRAGVARPSDARPVDAAAWVEHVVARWRATRPKAICRVHMPGPASGSLIVAEATIEQALTNLLNNAADAGGEELDVHVAWDARDLSVTVGDRGPGFPANILRDGGRAPVASATGGAGIGLMLTQAAVERCGGALELTNSPEGGAQARLRMPLAVAMENV